MIIPSSSTGRQNGGILVSTAMDIIQQGVERLGKMIPNDQAFNHITYHIMIKKIMKVILGEIVLT